MTTTQFRRQRREKPPELPSGEFTLQEPPTLPELQPKDPMMMFMMAPMMLGGGVMMLVMMSNRPHIGVPMFFGMLAMAGIMIVLQLSRAGRERRQTMRGDRRDYVRYLGQMREKVHDAAARQGASVKWRHPAPDSLWNLAMTARLWERRATHGDFSEVRVGIGAHQLTTRLTPPTTKPVADLEPLSARALRRFIAVHRAVPDLPISVLLRRYARLRLTGELDSARALARAIVAQLVTLHSAGELRVVVCAPPERAADWDWVKWLPHAQHPSEQDGAGSVRLIATTPDELESLLDADVASRGRFEPDAAQVPDEPYIVVILDSMLLDSGSRLVTSGYRAVTVIDIADRYMTGMPTRGTVWDVVPESVHLVRFDATGKEERTLLCRPDALSVPAARALARVLAPYRALENGSDSGEPMVADFELPTLLGISDLEQWRPADSARAALDRQRLRIPLGVDEKGRPVSLDVKEAAQGGMGPHGLLIGATGSGKSELLRTMVLGMAMTHSSEMLNFVLVDFKGGATFLGLDDLPHVSALITNLADEATLVTRMQDAVTGEMNRRQEYLREAGNYSSLLEHETARLAGAPLDAMPSLFVIVDEFSELLASNPDFAELFVMIGRLGRSLGVHLLLASQRLDDGRMSKLESHLSYRIGLRTFSASESRSVIGVPDAYQLPNAPGNGYLRSDVGTLTRFKAAYVSGTYRRRTLEQRQAEVRRQVVRFQSEKLVVDEETSLEDDMSDIWPGDPVPTAPEPESSETVMSVISDRLLGFGPPAHQVWLPPLDAPPTLDQLLPPLLDDPERGLHAIGWNGTGHLTVPIGVIDKPFEQTRELYEVNLSGAGGHVGIGGGPQSGKSTVLRTLVGALALTHTPDEVQFFCIDFGGGALAALDAMPHVGGVATRMQPERVARIIAEAQTMIAEREQFFSDTGLEGMGEYRARRAAGEFSDQKFGDLFLVVDGWSAMRAEFEQHDAAIRALARQGLTYGLHIMISTNRWTDVHSSLRDQLGTRIELKLGDHIDSVVNMRKAALVPQIPGRGLTPDAMHFLAGVPRIDGVSSPENLALACRSLGEELTEAWRGDPAPAVRMLPSVLDAAGLPDPLPGPIIALGHSEQDLLPVWHDFTERPHLSVVGDSGSGKTAALRLIASALPSVYTPEEVRVVLIDPRRGLLESVPEEYQQGAAYATSTTETLIASVVEVLRSRVPGPDISPAQLRRRDWWTGPDYFIFVDDYDLLLSTIGGPLAALIELIPLAGDVGLHLVLARAGAGSGRTAMDSVVRRLHESNTPELTLSMPPGEMLTFGGRGKALPPGRGAIVTRRESAGLQVGWSEPVR